MLDKLRQCLSFMDSNTAMMLSRFISWTTTQLRWRRDDTDCIRPTGHLERGWSFQASVIWRLDGRGRRERRKKNQYHCRQARQATDRRGNGVYGIVDTRHSNSMEGDTANNTAVLSNHSHCSSSSTPDRSKMQPWCDVIVHHTRWRIEVVYMTNYDNGRASIITCISCRHELTLTGLQRL